MENLPLTSDIMTRENMREGYILIGKSANALLQILLVAIVVVRVNPHGDGSQGAQDPAQTHWTPDDLVLQLKFSE